MLSRRAVVCACLSALAERLWPKTSWAQEGVFLTEAEAPAAVCRGAIMREFGRTGFRLSQLRRDAKWVYTGFLVFIGLGFGTNGVFQLVRIGPTLHRIAVHYRGGELARAMAFPKPFAELLELTHFHTFLMGVVFLILAHLVIATDVSGRLKTTLWVLACAGSLADIASYWLIRYVSPAWALLQLLSWLAMWAGYGGMIAVTLWDMWSTPHRKGTIGRPHRPFTPLAMRSPIALSIFCQYSKARSRFYCRARAISTSAGSRGSEKSSSNLPSERACCR